MLQFVGFKPAIFQRGQTPRFAAKKKKNTSNTPQRKVSQSRQSLSQRVLPEHCSDKDFLGHGLMMKLIDIAGGSVVREHEGGATSGKIVTSSIDRLCFVRPVKAFETLVTRAYMIKTWAQSMAVRVELFVRTPFSKKEELVSQGDLIFVPVKNVEDDASGATQYAPRDTIPLKLVHQTEKDRAAFIQRVKEQRLFEQRKGLRFTKERIRSDEKPAKVTYQTGHVDRNYQDTVFGGVMLDVMAQGAEKAAKAHAKGPALLIQMDRMKFRKPVDIGDWVEARAMVTRSWKTSMEIRVDLVAKKGPKANDCRFVAAAYFVFVGVDEDGNKREIPTFTPKTPAQKRRWEHAQLRYESRQKRAPKTLILN